MMEKSTGKMEETGQCTGTMRRYAYVHVLLHTCMSILPN